MTLRLRLLGAFAGVAALAIAVFAALTLWAGRENVDRLVARQQRATVAHTAQELADGYRASGGWTFADLRAARALALSGGAVLDVRDVDGAPVTLGRGMGLGMGPAMLGAALGPPRTAAVVVDGRRVGTVALRFREDALPPAERSLRDALARTTLVGAAIAVAVALLVGFVVAGGIVRPLRRLTEAVRRLGAGDRTARANLAAPGELGELAAAVDRMAASLEREDDLRRALTADVAHELRTPVSILSAHSEAILDGVEEPTPELIASLHEEVLRLARLIEDVETLAAAEAAGLRPARERVPVAPLVAGVVELLAAQAKAAGVTVSTRLDPEAVVVGDAGRLTQVVKNLLVNALKFTPPGGSVEVEAARAGRTVRVSVADSGVGIAADELPHVFERFWRGRGAEATDGSGIGLAVVAELVRVHGGRVDVTSEPGAGSTFTVELPAAGAPAPVAVASRA